jgi:hypothetical protein
MREFEVSCKQRSRWLTYARSTREQDHGRGCARGAASEFIGLDANGFAHFRICSTGLRSRGVTSTREGWAWVGCALAPFIDRSPARPMDRRRNSVGGRHSKFASLPAGVLGATIPNRLDARKTSLSRSCLHWLPIQSHYCGTKRAPLTQLQPPSKSANGMPGDFHSLAINGSRVLSLSWLSPCPPRTRWRRASGSRRRCGPWRRPTTAGAVWSRRSARCGAPS